MFESGFIGNYTKSLMNIRTRKKHAYCVLFPVKFVPSERVKYL